MNTTKASIVVLLSVFPLYVSYPADLDSDKTTTGKLIIETPTLISLGFEWRISGDENVNARADVTYRKKGTELWEKYLPFVRVGRGRTADYGFVEIDDPGHKMRYRIPDGLAGSIMDLEPDTEYEVRVEVSDPDGVEGERVKILTLKTRSEPMQVEGGEVRHVYPLDYEGEKEEPYFTNVMHAVNGFQPWCDCYQTVHPNKAKPGTKILLHAGVHITDFNDYRDAGGLWLHGMHTLIADGTPEKPIMIVAAGDGEVILDANGSDRYFNIAEADYLYFEGLTIRNTRIAFYAGLQGLSGSKGLTVKNCRLENVQFGVLAQDARSENFYIADNVFIGRNPLDRFNPESSGANGRTEAGYAVNVAGKGHVIAHNHVEGFWDGINVFTNSLADPEMGQQSRAIDIYNNDITNINDNFIEADGGYANIRILRNRCFNAMSQPLSIQPVYAGPVYWIRNVVYNASRGAQTFKMVNGDNVIMYHNTSTSHNGHYELKVGFKYLDSRNNLFLGPSHFVTERQEQRGLPIFLVTHDDERSIVDYNAVGARLEASNRYALLTPEQELFVNTLGEFTERTGLMRHGIEIFDYDIFVNAEEPEHVPSNEGRMYAPTSVDLRPRHDAPVVDKGCLLPGINDDFSGGAPDIGAYEAGQPMPRYGPRM